MKAWLTIFLLIYCALPVNAQATIDDEPLAVRVLALDTSVEIAKRFSSAIGTLAVGYQLAFIDNEDRHTARYVYKNKDETLRVDYRFEMQTSEDGTRPKKAVVNFQRISGELAVMAVIYNFLFGTNISPAHIMNYSMQGSPVTYRGHTYEASFLPDDMEPGYWVLTFR